MRWRVPVLLGLLLSLLIAGLLATPHFHIADPSLVQGRLPEHIRPLHYQVQLQLLPDETQFSGVTEIDLQLTERVKRFYLHAQDLQFSRIEISDDQKTWYLAEAQSEPGLLLITSPFTLSSGRAAVRLTYSGTYTNNQEGLWRQKVNNDWYVFNQFNTIFARRVIPGFDEPGIRASIDLSVVAPTLHHVISTSPLLETELMKEGRKLVRFTRTPPLSLHQLNISVGPFDIVTGPILKASEFRRHNLPIRAVTIKGQGARSQFALSQLGPMVEQAEQYFGMPFPFDKLDVIAVPNSTEGVLEHAGAINMLDRLMLFEQRGDHDAEREFLSYYTHGLLHHWLGNLVAMDWWHDAWLYESLAEWLTFRLLDRRYPELGFGIEQFQNKHLALSADMGKQTRLQSDPIVTDQAIHGAYESHNLLKGAALIRMLERYIREDRFQHGMRAFFARHAYDLASRHDLYQAVMEAVAHPTLARDFDKFVTDAGAPILHIERQCKDARLVLAVRQISEAADETPSHWTVPVCSRFLAETTSVQCLVIAEAEQLWPTAMPCETPFLPNADATGYYRWQLDEGEWQALIKHATSFSTIEAMEVAANLSHSYRQGKISAQQYWPLAGELSARTDHRVAELFIDDAQFSMYRLADTERPHLSKFLLASNRQWSVPVQEWLAMDQRDNLTRQQLLKQAKNRSKLDKSLDTDSLALAVLLEENPQEMRSLLAQLCEESQGDSRAQIINAISMVRTTKAHEQALQALTHHCLRNNEQWKLLYVWLAKPSVQRSTFTYLREHFAEFRKQQPAFRLTELPEMLGQFCDQGQWELAKQFLQSHIDETVGQSDVIIAAEHQTVQCLAMKQRLSQN